MKPYFSPQCLRAPHIPYKSLLFGPYVLLLVGVLFNFLVTFTNGQQMPVLLPNGVCTTAHLGAIHACMTHANHLKALGDIFVSNDGIKSAGDILQDLGTVLALPAFIAWLTLTIRDKF